MVAQSFPNNNQKKDIENKIYFYRFDYFIIYLFIFVGKIITLLKVQLLRIEELFYFQWDTYKKEFIRLENNYFKFKKESTIARILIENKNVNNDDNKIKEKNIKKIKNNINNNNIIIKYILINLIAFLTINILIIISEDYSILLCKK